MNEKPVPVLRASSFYDFFMEAFNNVKANDLLIDDPGFNKKVWVALGGDKGGRTTKFGFSFLNVEKPNSPQNFFLTGTKIIIKIKMKPYYFIKL